MEKPQKKLKSHPPFNDFSLDIQKQLEEAAYYQWIDRALPPESAQKDWSQAIDEIVDSLNEKQK